jgi:hypothetical protein
LNKVNFDKLDKIYLNGKDVEKIMEWDRLNHHKFDSISLPLEEGIISIEDYHEKLKFHHTTWTYFKIEEDGILFKQYDGSDGFEMISFKISGSEGDGENFTDYVKDIKSNIKIASKETVKKQIQLSAHLCFCVFQYMTNVSNNVVEQKETKTIKKKQKNKKYSGNNKNRYVKISTIRYTFDHTDNEGDSKHYDRHAHSWTVRGHWRYYKKSGKRVWIKPHKKGAGEIEPKKYKL